MLILEMVTVWAPGSYLRYREEKGEEVEGLVIYFSDG